MSYEDNISFLIYMAARTRNVQKTKPVFPTAFSSNISLRFKILGYVQKILDEVQMMSYNVGRDR